MTLNVVLCVFQTRFECSPTLVVNGFDYVLYKIEQALTSNSLLHAVQHDICWLKSRNLSAKLATLNVVLCGFQTRFNSLITHVVNDLGYVIPQIEQSLTLNSLSVVHLDISRFKFGNLSAKLVTLNVVLCGFKTRLKHSLTLVMDDIDYDIHEIDPSLTSNNPLCVV